MTDGLRLRAAGVQLIALAALVVLAGVARARLPLDQLYSLKAAAAFTVIAALVVVFIDADAHPFAQFGSANQVTTGRAVFVALVMGAIGEPATAAVAAGAAAAAMAVTMMDGVDGWVARRGMASRFGARFDMEIDALLILALAILTWRHGKAGGWVLLSGLLRYLFVAAGSLLPQMQRPLPVSRRRQTICVIQVLALIAALEPFVAPEASQLIAGAALAALVYSFTVDTIWLFRSAPVSVSVAPGFSRTSA
jgi:phosphatidylglycerophosphate synthase